jgi:hypothetical protein
MLSFWMGQWPCGLQFYQERLAVNWLEIELTTSPFNVPTYRSNLCWRSVDAHFNRLLSHDLRPLKITLINVWQDMNPSIRPHKNTCCSDWSTVANVDASYSGDDDELIARDLWLSASRLYRKEVPWPRVTCRRYIIPFLMRRALWLHKLFNRNGKKRKH